MKWIMDMCATSEKKNDDNDPFHYSFALGFIEVKFLRYIYSPFNCHTSTKPVNSTQKNSKKEIDRYTIPLYQFTICNRTHL